MRVTQTKKLTFLNLINVDLLNSQNLEQVGDTPACTVEEIKTSKLDIEKIAILFPVLPTKKIEDDQYLKRRSNRLNAKKYREKEKKKLELLDQEQKEREELKNQLREEVRAELIKEMNTELLVTEKEEEIAQLKAESAKTLEQLEELKKQFKEHKEDLKTSVFARNEERANSERKVYPVDWLGENTSKSKEFIEQRERIAGNLQTSANVIMECPSYLDEKARGEWYRVLSLYDEMPANILSDLDISTLVIYCQAFSMYREAQENQKKFGTLISTDNKTQRVLDANRKIMNEQAKIMLKCSADLCLSPISRARMGVNPADTEEPTNPLEKLMEKYA